MTLLFPCSEVFCVSRPPFSEWLQMSASRRGQGWWVLPWPEIKHQGRTKIGTREENEPDRTAFFGIVGSWPGYVMKDAHNILLSNAGDRSADRLESLPNVIARASTCPPPSFLLSCGPVFFAGSWPGVTQLRRGAVTHICCMSLREYFQHAVFSFAQRHSASAWKRFTSSGQRRGHPVQFWPSGNLGTLQPIHAAGYHLSWKIIWLFWAPRIGCFAPVGVRFHSDSFWFRIWVTRQRAKDLKDVFIAYVVFMFCLCL